MLKMTPWNKLKYDNFPFFWCKHHHRCQWEHSPIHRKFLQSTYPENHILQSTENPQKIYALTIPQETHRKSKIKLKNPEKEEPPFPKKNGYSDVQKIHNNIKVQCNSFGGGEVGQMVTVERNGRRGGLETPKVYVIFIILIFGKNEKGSSDPCPIPLPIVHACELLGRNQ